MIRTLNCNGSTIDVDLGQSWKLYDNNNISESISIYSGYVYKQKTRIFWIETDNGGFIINPNEDLSVWVKKTGIGIDRLQKILQDPINKFAIGQGFR